MPRYCNWKINTLYHKWVKRNSQLPLSLLNSLLFSSSGHIQHYPVLWSAEACMVAQTKIGRQNTYVNQSMNRSISSSDKATTGKGSGEMWQSTRSGEERFRLCTQRRGCEKKELFLQNSRAEQSMPTDSRWRPSGRSSLFCLKLTNRPVARYNEQGRRGPHMDRDRLCGVLIHWVQLEAVGTY